MGLTGLAAPIGNGSESVTAMPASSSASADSEVLGITYCIHIDCSDSCTSRQCGNEKCERLYAMMRFQDHASALTQQGLDAFLQNRARHARRNAEAHGCLIVLAEKTLAQRQQCARAIARGTVKQDRAI
jgi:hypothetical protein